MKKVAIIQSNYIPWKGYFDIIASVDEFILYDDMQYTRRDWRNRNRIMTPNGPQWLTIPVSVKGKFYQRINETKVANHDWIDDHWKAIQMNYARARFFQDYKDRIQCVYEKCREEDYLSRINYRFLKEVCDILTEPTFLISDKIKRLFSLYDKSISFKAIQVFSTAPENKRAPLYWVAKFEIKRRNSINI